MRTLPAEPGVRGKRAIPKKDVLGDAVWGRMHTDTRLKKSGRTEPCVNSVLVDGAWADSSFSQDGVSTEFQISIFSSDF